MSLWTFSHRSQAIRSSAIRELLKLCERPGMLSLAGGLPSPASFPAQALREVADQVLRDRPGAALQYGASEGLAGLRAWVAAHLRGQGLAVDPAQVLITTGSQQALDLVGKVLAEEGAPIAVEAPTYLGALQAFALYGPRPVALAGDDEGPLPQAILDLPQRAPGCRFGYLLPTFQNPSGRVMSVARRAAVAAAAQAVGLPLIEDDPYGALWYDEAPPAPLATHWPEGTVYLGSFSKVLAPGLRLGYLVAPPALLPRLLQAKQAADLHSSTLAQHLALALLERGTLDHQLPALRARYRASRDAMQAALTRELPPGCRWQRPAGGMFFWVELPEGLDGHALLPAALQAGVAFVPGAEFHPAMAAAGAPAAAGSAAACAAPALSGEDAASLALQRRCLRLSFVTLDPAQIDEAVQRLAGVIEAARADTTPAAAARSTRPAAALPA